MLRMIVQQNTCGTSCFLQFSSTFFSLLFFLLLSLSHHVFRVLSIIASIGNSWQRHGHGAVGITDLCEWIGKRILEPSSILVPEHIFVSWLITIWQFYSFWTHFCQLTNYHMAVFFFFMAKCRCNCSRVSCLTAWEFVYPLMLNSSYWSWKSQQSNLMKFVWIQMLFLLPCRQVTQWKKITRSVNGSNQHVCYGIVKIVIL